MELNQVRYFVALSRHLNFTRAAEEFGISQPALSKAIQKLEREIGNELIFRERQYMHLTDIGRRVLPALEQLIAAADSVNTLVHEHQIGRYASLRLGLTPWLPGPEIVGMLANVVRLVPGLQVEFVESETCDLFDLLLKGQIDVAIGTNIGKAPERIDRWKLYEDHLVVLLRCTDPLSRMQSIPLSVLADATWLQKAGCEFTTKLFEVMRNDGLAPIVAHRSSHDGYLQHMIEAGLGITVTSSHASFSKTLNTRPIQGDPVHWSVELLAAAGRRYTPAVSAFIKAVRFQHQSVDRTMLNRDEDRHGRNHFSPTSISGLCKSAAVPS